MSTGRLFAVKLNGFVRLDALLENSESVHWSYFAIFAIFARNLRHKVSMNRPLTDRLLCADLMHPPRLLAEDLERLRLAIPAQNELEISRAIPQRKNSVSDSGRNSAGRARACEVTNNPPPLTATGILYRPRGGPFELAGFDECHAGCRNVVKLHSVGNLYCTGARPSIRTGGCRRSSMSFGDGLKGAANTKPSTALIYSDPFSR